MKTGMLILNEQELELLHYALMQLCVDGEEMLALQQELLTLLEAVEVA
jgi:hypothetical protein